MAAITAAGRVPVWTLGDRLRKARDEAGLTQQELAEVTGISRTTIGSYEAGETAPRRPQLVAWAMATGVDYQWLLTGGDLPNPPSAWKGDRRRPRPYSTSLPRTLAAVA